MFMGPAHQLTGLTLPGNWKVLQLAARKPNATGSNFSVGYVVENENGRRGFLKAIDYFGAFNQGLNTPDVLNAMTSAYIFERDICEKCRDHRLSRIVHAIDSGSHQLDPKQGITRVDYLIFELADSDIRAHLDAQQHFDVAFALRTLHNVATGLSQMHAHEMAHQDLKPSNVLIFKGPVTSKIGDLGRAWSKHHTAPHDTHPIAGEIGRAHV
jgi:serine/threonine protein kinase